MIEQRKSKCIRKAAIAVAHIFQKVDVRTLHSPQMIEGKKVSHAKRDVLIKPKTQVYVKRTKHTLLPKLNLQKAFDRLPSLPTCKCCFLKSTILTYSTNCIPITLFYRSPDWRLMSSHQEVLKQNNFCNSSNKKKNHGATYKW